MKSIVEFERVGWLHFYQMSDFLTQEFLPKSIVKADGVRVWNEEGKEFIDAISGAYCVNIGYGRKEVLQEAYNAACQVSYVSPFSATSAWTINLAFKLSNLVTDIIGKDSRVFFLNSGSEAIDAAIKLARAYYRNVGYKDKPAIITRNRSFHGTTYGALSAGGDDSLHDIFAPTLPKVNRIPSSSCHICEFSKTPSSCELDCLTHRSVFSKVDKENIAAILIEPIESSTGTGITKAEYFKRLNEKRKEFDCLLILDEVITGFGRTGTWFAAEHYGINPDIIVCAKGLTSGYESLAAIIVRKEIAASFLGNFNSKFHHGTTFAARPSACAVSLKVIELLETEKLIENTKKQESYFLSIVKEYMSNLSIVGPIRGKGLMISIDIVIPNMQRQEFLYNIRKKLFKAGIISTLYFTQFDCFLDIAPPLIISKEDFIEVISRISGVLKEVSKLL